ncbi:response regulator transcription factor [Mycoplasmatota bacterium]|nr:response regulator transcription factor [Mycoplasmatota bacterium]
MRIVIIDDDHLICDGLKLIFELEDDFEVVGTGHNGKEAYDLCNEQNPDLVLMDIRMPNVDGVSATSTIKKDFPQIKVILLTTFKDNEYIKAALNYGAEGYILKSQKADSIIKSVRAVGKGSVVFEKDIANMIPELISSKKYASPKDYQLTEREFDVVKLVGQGFSNKEISQKLFLSEGTVRNYLTLILEKLNLRDRTQLAIFYVHHFE